VNACPRVCTAVLLAAAAAAGHAAESTGEKFLDGRPVLFAVVGPSTSKGWPVRLRRKLVRLLGRSGEACPAQVVSFATPMARIPSWVDTGADGAPKRGRLYQQHVSPLLEREKRGGRPVVVLSMNNTALALYDHPHGIDGPNDQADIALASGKIAAYVQAMLDDGARRVFLGPKLWWRSVDESGPIPWSRNEGLYALPEAAKRLPGRMTAVPGIWERMREAGVAAYAEQEKPWHANQYGDEILASCFFRALCSHDGIPVPAWDEEEVAYMKQQAERDPAAVRRINLNLTEYDQNLDGNLTREELLRVEPGKLALRSDEPGCDPSLAKKAEKLAPWISPWPRKEP
jgi:hypothetical protein